MTIERICLQCSYRTTRPVAICPLCDVPLRHRERGWAEARQAVRVPLPPGVRAEVDGQVAVTVLDLSPLGARLEHAELLPPDPSCFLTLALPEVAPLRLSASIVWTQTHPFGA